VRDGHCRGSRRYRDGRQHRVHPLAGRNRRHRDPGPLSALEAVERGVDALIVSNHGGRSLDGVPASIEALPAIAEAVGDRCEVYMDGGIRRGTDVFKALALGARAVFVGCPILWGLAVDGAEGARRVLEILRHELEVAMVLAGCPTPTSIDASAVHVPRQI
jgi:4-hydroxymandelate oxidase